ncbi:DNA methylase [Rhodobacter phage RcAqua]|nr:DNA methylase [Rhodobacter phage RcAqua]UUV43023.1 DNA methylase [Rhodobacter phage RcAquaphina]
MQSTVTLYPGDNIASMRSLPSESIHSVVTDPPYLLESIVKRFGKRGAAAARTEGNDGSFARLSGGFMNKTWDSPNVELPAIDADFANYMAGLIDGEGCFHVHKKQVNGCETYDCQFSISLRSDDYDILAEMQRRLGGIGSLAHKDRKKENWSPQVRYCISSKADCMILSAVLSTFPLRAKKKRDFEIWQHALDAWVNHEAGSGWDDVAFYRDQLMLVRKFGSFYKPEILFHYRWANEVFRLLKPGGFCFAFSGARTGHWQACAMEAAGFIMHPFHVWAYGSGFPKAKDVEKELVKAGFNDEELLAEWSGWKFGTQSQKPAVEPIYLAQRPISEKTYIANIKKHGVGAVNIDGCRVPLDSVADAKQLRTMNRNRREDDTSGQSWGLSKKAGAVAQVVDENGRYPANLLHDNSPEVLELFPKDAGSAKVEKVNSVNAEVDLTRQPEIAYPASTARFFNAFPSDECPALLYHPKANKEDRGGSEHPTVKPVGLLRHLIRHITPPGGVVLDPFAGSGTTAIAARAEGVDCIIMEAEGEYIEFLQERFGRSLNVEGTGVDANTTDLSDLFLANATTNDELLV